MKAKYIITLCFIFSLVVGVFFFEPPIAYLFLNSKGDCSGRSLFMYSAIYQNKTERDVVLFGSSKTMCGINDSLLNQIGKERILNLGYCRFGRNLDVFFIKEYCKTHHPKKIVLEVRQIESGETHPLTPFLMPLNAFSFNQNIVEDLYNKWLCNLKYLRIKIFAKTEEASFPQQNQSGYWQRNSTAQLSELIKEFSKDSLNMHSLDTNKSLPNQALFNNLKTFCDQKKIQLCFLYLSAYGNLVKKPASYNEYKSYGKVLCVPDSILCNPYNFADLGHFNMNGSNKLSLWFAKEISKN